jgi:Tfp pilus assembly protein PilX
MADQPAKRSPRAGAGPRLAVIEGFAGRRSAIPFALLVLGVLGAGLVVLLMLNTAMDDNSIQMQQAQQKQAALTDREQQLSQQLAGLSAPSSLASQAAGLGLVPNPQPAFLNPSSGVVLGTASPAPTPSPTPTPTPTATPTGTPTPSGSMSGTPTKSASAGTSASASATTSASPSTGGSPR